jgi:hypothetical protein
MELIELSKALSANRRVRIDPDDPVMMLPQIMESITADVLAKIQKVQTEYLDQISALHAQAENSAAKRGEKLLVDGAAFMEKRFQTAAAEAASDYVAETRKGLADMIKLANRTIWATWICAATAGCSAIATVAVLWL